MSENTENSVGKLPENDALANTPVEEAADASAGEPVNEPSVKDDAADSSVSEDKQATPLPTRKQRAKKITLDIISVISALAFLVSGTVIAKRGVDYYKMKQVESDVQDLTIPDSSLANVDSRDPAYLQALITKYPYLADVQFPTGFNYKYALLYAKNHDFVGYLTIPNTSIDTAVVQHSDDDYYYKHDFYGNESKYGAVFAIAQNDMVTLDQNTVIIGHHMRDGSRFHDLIVYKTIDGYKTCPVIEFDTPYGNYQWKVYGAFILNGSPSGDNGYKLDCLFSNVSQANFAAYIYEISKRTLYTTGVDIEPTDKILTLMTCTYEFDNARLLVIARLVRDGEDATVDLSKVTEKTTPIKYPQAYYDKHDKKNPYINDTKWYPN